MSLFNDLKWEIIQNPKYTYNYIKVLREEKESEEEKEKRLKKEWKELCAQKKQELSKDEFDKRRAKEWYQWNKKWYAKKQLEKYHKNKAEEEVMIEEIYKDIYDTIPDPINWDKYYLEKFKEDDTDYEWKYKFSWRSSKIIFENWRHMPKYKKPIRIIWRRWMTKTINNLYKEEGRAYQLLQPHLSELMDAQFSIKRHQTITKYPLRNVSWKLAKLIQYSDISPSHICNVLSAIQRGKYIASEVYLWRTSFIMGDVVVTQTGHMYQPCLENNIPWLTPETIEDIHNVRMKRRKKKWKEKPPLYMVNDAYLVKIHINEREFLSYIIPT